MRWQSGEYGIESDLELLSLETIVEWLQTTYWAATRSESLIRQAWHNSAFHFGLFYGQDFIGCARVVSDRVAIAYLADVYILEQHRGRGLGTWLVKTIVEHPDLTSVGWLLHTRDAQRLYELAGFLPPGPRVMERPRAAE